MFFRELNKMKKEKCIHLLKFQIHIHESYKIFL